MIKFCSLFSGSSGNSAFLATEKIKILIDAGLSATTIERALVAIGEKPADLDAILITHEHSDHIKGAGVLSRKYGLPVYTNLATWKSMAGKTGAIGEGNLLYFETGQAFEICDLLIEPFNIPHNAVEPVGFSFFSKEKKITFATDLGYVDNRLAGRMEGSDLLFIEANHDVELLKVGSYPQWLKARVLSEVGHLSNEMAGDVIVDLAEKGSRNFILGHLSRENNFPELAYQTVSNALLEKKIQVGKDVSLQVARRESASRVHIL